MIKPKWIVYWSNSILDSTLDRPPVLGRFRFKFFALLAIKYAAFVSDQSTGMFKRHFYIERI